MNKISNTSNFRNIGEYTNKLLIQLRDGKTFCGLTTNGKKYINVNMYTNHLSQQETNSLVDLILTSEYKDKFVNVYNTYTKKSTNKSEVVLVRFLK